MKDKILKYAPRVMLVLLAFGLILGLVKAYWPKKVITPKQEMEAKYEKIADSVRVMPDSAKWRVVGSDFKAEATRSAAKRRAKLPR